MPEVLTCASCGAASDYLLLGRRLFMRHGVVNENEENITVGNLDPPMNQRGFQQVLNACPGLGNMGIDLVVTSTLGRAEHGAIIISDILCVPLIRDFRLRERCVGELQGQPETPESDARLLDPDFLPLGATPLSSFEAETGNFLASWDLPATFKGAPIANALFVTHGFRMLTIVKLIRCWSVERIMAYTPPGNCQVLEFGITKPCRVCGNRFCDIAIEK